MGQPNCNTGAAPVTYAIRPAVTDDGELLYQIRDVRRRAVLMFFTSLSIAQAVLAGLEQGAEDGEAGSWR